jgi:hypothetical protein
MFLLALSVTQGRFAILGFFFAVRLLTRIACQRAFWRGLEPSEPVLLLTFCFMCRDREIGRDGAPLFVLRQLLAGEREQGQAKGTNPQENPIEGGLVSEKTSKQGRAAFFLHNL